MKLQTKEQRTNLLNSIIERKTSNGYKLEIYKGLQFLVKTEGEKFFLECYKDNSTKPILNYYYKVESQMFARIEQTKKSYDLSIEYKAKRKAEQSGRLTGAAACADAIRAELKTIFSGVKFSVRSETFSGGDAVRISWNDGVSAEEVEKITGKYSMGHFNGMEDIYEYSNRNDLPQAKYITTSRSMSAESEAILKPIAESLFNSFIEEGQNRPYNCWDASQFLYRIFCQTSFIGVPVGIVSTGETCGIASPEVFYKIAFDELETKATSKPEAQEVETDKIKVIQYSEKSLAVIGDTFPIKDKLKALGGRFNKFLSCGAGWVFPLSAAETLKQAFAKPETEQKQEIKTTLKDEIEKTVNFFANHDLLLHGEIQESTREIAEIQKVDIYQKLNDIEQAAKSGKIISLCNLSQLVNQKQAQA